MLTTVLKRGTDDWILYCLWIRLKFLAKDEIVIRMVKMNEKKRKCVYAKITSHMFAYVTGEGIPCPYGQTGTSLATCNGE